VTVDRVEDQRIMGALADFLRGLFEDGRIAHRDRPPEVDEDRAGATSVLAAAFDLHRLDVAGPPIPFDAPSALAAGDLVRQASWFLVDRSEPVEAMARRLAMPPAPRTAAQHLSADLALRFLPQLHRRARALAASDRLQALLADVLRRWPLSGVLSDLEDGPDDVGDLGGHPGLRLLYAERVARSERPGWMPSGAASDHVELVLQGLGKGRSPLLRPRPATAATADEGANDG